MKIAIISSLFSPFGIGGAEQVASQIAEMLHCEGHSVDVVSTGRKESLDGKAYKVDIWSEIRVWRIAPWNFYWRFDREQERPGRLTRAAWHFVDLWNPSVIGPLKEVLRRIRPDVVNTHNIDGLSPVVWQVARRHGAAVVHTLHDYHLICPRAVMQRRDGTLCNGLCATCRIYAAYHTRFQDCLDTFIAPSKAIGDVHRSAGWHVPTVVVPNGVDLPEASIPERAPNSPLQVVFMSRLVVEKGCDMMLKTIESFRDCRDIHFHVAGRGAYENRFNTLADSVPNLTWHGYITGSAKTALLGAGDVFLQLSECPENAPLAMLEAKLYGLYLIGTKIGGIPEIISSAEGELFGVADAATLRSMLLGHISKRALLRAQRLSRIACNRGYDVRAMARQYLNVFYSARDEVSNPVKRRAGS